MYKLQYLCEDEKITRRMELNCVGFFIFFNFFKGLSTGQILMSSEFDTESNSGG